MIQLSEYRVDELPEGERGNIKIERFEVSRVAADTQSLQCLMQGNARMIVPPGVYTRLIQGGWIVWMSDTPFEIRTQYPLFKSVSYEHDKTKQPPTVLLHGLGLGVALKGCILNGAEHVTVIEKNPDVVALSGAFWEKQYPGKVTIIEADSLEWKPGRGERWDLVWHDIWPNISVDNKDGMSKLHRRYGRRCKWQDSWCRKDVLQEARRARQRFW